MGLKHVLILILLFCIAFLSYALYFEYVDPSDNSITEIDPLIQEPLPDIIHLDTFYLYREIIGNSRIIIIHDDKRNVTCYLYNRMTYGGGISCIPDSEIQSSGIDNNYKRCIAR